MAAEPDTQEQKVPKNSNNTTNTVAVADADVTPAAVKSDNVCSSQTSAAVSTGAYWCFHWCVH